MKRLAILILALLSCSMAFGYERAQGYCERGGFNVYTQNIASTTKVQRSFVSCTVTVYVSGTVNLATLFSDNNTPVPTPLGNPFTAASDGSWFFYAAGGRYDVHFSNGGIPSAFTRGDVEVCDPLGPNPDATCTPGVGGGTVTNFGAGNLSPLFTTNITNPTTTPNLTFTLTNSGAFTLFGNNTNAPAPPAFMSMDALFGSCATVNSALTFNTATHVFGCNSFSTGIAGLTAGTIPVATSAVSLGDSSPAITQAGGFTLFGPLAGNPANIGIGTSTPSHTVHIVTNTNNALGIDSTGIDSDSMIHIKNVGVQGPFMDFHAATQRWAFGIGSAGNFDVRNSGVGTDPVNGTTLFRYGPDGGFNLATVAAPANPAGGFIKLYADSGTGNLTCLKSTGANCLPTGTTVSVNSGAVANPNFNDTTPVAPVGNTNVAWQVSGSDVSAYVPTATGTNSITRTVVNDTLRGTTDFTPAVMVLNDVTGGHGAVAYAQTVDANNNGDSYVGITHSGGGTAGNSVTTTYGDEDCIFDNATTFGNYFGQSLTNDRRCHDWGPPDSTNDGAMIRVLLGFVMETGVAGKRHVFLTPISPTTQGFTANPVYPYLVGTLHGNYYSGSDLAFDTTAGVPALLNSIPFRFYSSTSSATRAADIGLVSSSPKVLGITYGQTFFDRTMNGSRSQVFSGAGATNIDFSLGNKHVKVINGDVTSVTNSNAYDLSGAGPIFIFSPCQDGTGGRKFTYGTDFPRGASAVPAAKSTCVTQLWANLATYGDTFTAVAPAVPIHPPALTGQTSAIAATTLAHPMTALLTRANIVVTCESTSAGATVTGNIVFTDVSNTAQTLSTSAATCTALGAASYASATFVLLPKADTDIQYSTSIANTPTYTVSVSLETIQ